MKRINKEGPRVLGAIRSPARLPGTRLGALLAERVPVVDLRPATVHMARHVPGTLGIPFTKSFSTWAGWLLPYDRDVALLAPDESTAAAAVHELALIGIDRVRGWLAPDALQAWVAAGRTLESTPQLSVAELAERMAVGEVERGELAVVDVRNHTEWEAGHLPGVPNIPVGLLRDHLAELPRDRPLAVHCQTGARAAIASSVLRAEGFDRVLNVPGGFVEWQEAGHAVETAPSSGGGRRWGRGWGRVGTGWGRGGDGVGTGWGRGGGRGGDGVGTEWGRSRDGVNETDCDHCGSFRPAPE